jgi:hypothetical protein
MSYLFSGKPSVKPEDLSPPIDKPNLEYKQFIEVVTNIQVIASYLKHGFTISIDIIAGVMVNRFKEMTPDADREKYQLFAEIETLTGRLSGSALIDWFMSIGLKSQELPEIIYWIEHLKKFLTEK